jgi:23S rRNA (cytosine1962-C5)-methyltransferase
MKKVILKSGREKSLQRHHPWVFSGSIGAVDGNPAIGETVEICDLQGEFLAYGAYSPESQIRVRVWSWEKSAIIDPEFFRVQINRAINLRIATSGDLSAMRLIHAESDGLPGLIVDRYEDVLVMQVLSAGVEYWRETIADLLIELTYAKYIYERSDVDVREIEGLPGRTGSLRGGEPPEKIQIEENGLMFLVDVREGHKTGSYLDQRENRKKVRNLAAGKDILDCFAYTGGFTVNALAGGASSVTAIDSSADALDIARENVALNGFAGDEVEFLVADVFYQLRKFRDQNKKFDMIILDPPKFAPTAAQAQKAARGYKDINLLAFKLLRPGGVLVTFSCSGGVGVEFFQKIIAGAALDAGVSCQIIDHLKQSPDHPVALNFPEGAYLKGFIIRILEM